MGLNVAIVNGSAALTEMELKSAEPGVSELAPRAAWFSEKGRSGLCF